MVLSILPPAIHHEPYGNRIHTRRSSSADPQIGQHPTSHPLSTPPVPSRAIYQPQGHFSFSLDGGMLVDLHKSIAPEGFHEEKRWQLVHWTWQPTAAKAVSHTGLSPCVADLSRPFG
ncbi:hypothetical protein WJX84_005054 [Apatococcus fuscideae]|uniref:Uncharacterized protein n=1 Tax=Apatococcus fuscideae TaxID=2026836 RepID=A0AAW1SN23_9CHLO